MTGVIDQLGGEAGLRALVDRFYELIESRPEGRDILHMHFRGHGLSHARSEQFNFLCGFFGGPRYYAENHGHMSLRDIHAHLSISADDAENWLLCMDLAMADCAVPQPLRDRLMQALSRAAKALISQTAQLSPQSR